MNAEKLDKRIVLPVKGKAVTFHPDQIAWLQAKRNYTLLWIENQAHAVRKPLKQMLRELDPEWFVQVHRSAAVNLRKIKSVHFWIAGHHEILLQTGETIVVSRRRIDALKAFRALTR